MHIAAQTLTSYVPDWLAQWVQDEGVPTGPRSRRVRAAVLFADIQGFTALSEALARQGPAGVETLSERLTSHFGQVVDTVARFGGDVTKLGGDSLLALWLADGDLGAAAARAHACARAIQDALRANRQSENLATRIGVGAGDLELALLGGVQDQWEFTVAGPALARAAEAEKRAAPGTVELAPGTPLTPQPAGAPLARRTSLPPGLETFVPHSVRHRLEADRTAWLAELRRITVLFAHLPELHEGTPLEQRQAMVESLQRPVFDLGGSVNKLAVDEKGTLLLGVFGLPPRSHEDDAVRALRAATAMAQTLPCSVGIATGVTFCGTVGNDHRREYTVLGSVVNLAARLMGASNGILCDTETRSAARQSFRFEALDLVRLKGLEDAQAVYRPVAQMRARPRTASDLVGRSSENQLFDRLLDEVRRGAPARVLLVDGEAGIGKSRLMEEWADRLRQAGLEPLVGEGDAMERATPYHAWARLLAEVMELEEELAARRERVLHVLQPWPDLLRLAPLLNDVLPLELPDSDFTAAMKGVGRSNNTLHLVVEILRRLRNPSPQQPLAVLLDDTHWFDSSSWSLVHALATWAEHVLLVVAGRPLEPPRPPAVERLERHEGTTRLTLETLTPQECLELVCRRLRVPSLPGPVADLITARAEGNPFFSEEIALALRDSGVLLVGEGRCEMAPGSGVDAVTFPGTIQGVITSRIDGLEPIPQMVMKVASVIGRTFLQRVVEAVFPIASELPRIPDCLRLLQRLDLTPLHVAPPETEYLFKHALTRDVAYDLMLFSQRRELHAAVAAWYEREWQHELSSHYSLLAYHWEKAGEKARAVDYLARAGERALRTGANREAVDFFRRLLALTRDDASYSPAQLGRWERRLGTAHFHLGEHGPAVEHHSRAIRLLGHPFPGGEVGFGVLAVRALLRQVWHRLPLRKRPARYDDTCEEVARAWGDLSEVYYFENLALRTVCAGVQRLNYAERAGPGSKECAAGLGAVTVILSFSTLHGVADAYARMTEKESRSSPDADCRSYGLLCAAMHYVGVANWEKAQEVVDEALALARAMGVQQRTGESSTVQAFSRYYRGRLEGAVEAFDIALSAGNHADNDLLREWGHSGRSGPLLPLGRLDEAIEAAEKALVILEHKKDPTEKMRSLANIALASLRRGDRATARARADEALGVLRKDTPQPVAYHPLDGYLHTCMVYLELAEETGDPALLKLGEEAVKFFHGYSACFPVGSPSSALVQGTAWWLRGRREAARQQWHKALALAEKLRTPYAEGLACLELGRTLEAAAPERAAWLDRAARVFTEMGAVLDLERVSAATRARGG